MKDLRKKSFAPINNFAALKEAEEKYYVLPGDSDIIEFLNYWNLIYEVWLDVVQNPINQSRLDHKIKVHKQLIELKL